ncbi:MFS transporter [Mycetocola sp. 2940]|uniref:MFS transporter n=1 Tax=Mycetocola sp. 2940 TaxID=3156452 RepID=UPI00339934C9
MKSLFASTAGNLLEWYEWSAYAVFSPFIAAAMFEPSDPGSALLATFAVFAVGFLMRPIGGWVFGLIGDRRGRKFVLLITMLMMAAACFLIGLAPGYAQIGVWASVLLLVLRCLQGFAHGGESAASTTYVAEIAPKEKRGLWTSAVFIAITGGSVLAFLIGAIITSIFGAEAVGEWAWRIPFILGGLLALVVLWLRRNMDESDVFEEDAADAALNATPPTTRAQNVRIALKMIFFTAGVTAVNYTWGSYMTTFAITQRGMEASTAYWMSVIAQLICCISMPFWGMLSDRVGRKPMIFVFAIASIALTIPLTTLISDQGWTLLVAVGIALTLWAIPGSIYSAVLAENFPTRIRTRGIGIAYALSVALFGGTAPYLNQLFVSFDLGWMFSVYIMFLCVLTIVATLFMKETKGIDLKDA